MHINTIYKNIFTDFIPIAIKCFRLFLSKQTNQWPRMKLLFFFKNNYKIFRKESKTWICVDFILWNLPNFNHKLIQFWKKNNKNLLFQIDDNFTQKTKKSDQKNRVHSKRRILTVIAAMTKTMSNFGENF